MSDKIEITLSPRIRGQLQRLVDEGWFKSLDDAIEVAVRYYLERHTDELWQDYVEHEIKVGLHAEQ